MGDINDDGNIDQYDYLLAKRAYFDTYSFSEDEAARGDVDQNGINDQYDYLLIKRHYFGTYTIESEDTVPDVSEPDVSEPDVSEPDTSEPEETVPETKPFWVTHYNDLTAEGAGVIVTVSGITGGTWNNYYAFAPVSGLNGVYENVATSMS